MAKVRITGTIVEDGDKWIYDWFGIRATCPGDIHRAVEEAGGEELTVEVNSGGGDVAAGNEIYTALRMYRGKVNIIITGMAASAASYITAARKCSITPVGLYMIHNASGGANGDYHAMDKESEILQTINKAITAAYMEKTSMSQEELLGLMDKETWLTAQQAVEYGFVDSIVENQEHEEEADRMAGFFNGKNPVAVYNSTQILDRKTIEKAREMLSKQIPGAEENTTPESAAAACPESVLIDNHTGKKEVNEEMGDTQGTNQEANIQTTDELSDRYPALVQQIRDAAALDAAKAENERLKAIDEIAGQISEEMVRSAKYGEDKMTAQDLALAAFRKNGLMAGNTFSDLKDDIAESGTGKIGTQANAGTADDSEEERTSKIKNLSEKFKRK